MRSRRKSPIHRITVGRITVSAAIGVLALASGGTASDEASDTPAASPAPTEAQDIAEGPVESDTSVGSTTPEAGSTDDSSPDQTVPETASPEATTAPEISVDTIDAGPAEPVVGGRTLAAEVQPSSQIESSPFPDLIVEDIGKGTQVNVANILPSDRPVLLWAWAPH